MGTLLNGYKNTTKDMVSSFAKNAEQIGTGILPISPIEVIEVNDFESILDLESILSKENVYPGSKRLLETLASLSVEDRKKKIAQYSQAVSKKLLALKRKGKFIDLAQSGAEGVAGIVTKFNFLRLAISILKLANRSALKNIGLYRNTLNKIDEALNSSTVDQANVHFLTKINRVAKLRDIG